MMRKPLGMMCVLVAGVLGLMLPGAGASAQDFEVGFDRPGADFHDLDLARPDPALCQAACRKDSRCLAWTYLAPGGSGEKAHCWLKGEIPDPVENEQCTSGLRGAGIVDEAGLEPITNRPGGDFRDLDLASPDPVLCQKECNRSRRCLAWTYVRPGAEGEAAHCWLKSEVPEPVLDESCVSGVKHGVDRPLPAGTPEQVRL